MNIRPEYQSFLTANSLFHLDQLPENIQVVAIQNVLDAEREAFLMHVSAARAAIKENLHTCINDRHFISRINSIRIKLKCPKYRRSFIMSNLCEFEADGTYRTYVGQTN